MPGTDAPLGSEDPNVPHAPWRLKGRLVLGSVRVPAGALDGLLSAAGARRLGGLRRSPGPGALVAASYTDSPVGPYDELTLAVPARIGLRPGMAAALSVVNNAEARRGGQRNWGMPAEVGALRWSHSAGQSTLHWEERGLSITGVPLGPVLPFLVPLRSVQHRSDGPVVVPRRLWGRVRLARTIVSLLREDDEDDDEDGLSWLAGAHPGAVVEGMRMVVHPARRPIGLLSSLRAPLRAPEPALAGEPLQ